MTNKQPSFLARWMISPLESLVIVAIIILAIGGLFASVQDALQLEEAINLNLTQNLILAQGVVNLQREVLLTHDEVLRSLGGLDTPPKPVTRFDFVEIQVNNLVTEAATPSSNYIFADEDLALIHRIETQAAGIEKLIVGLTQAGITPEQSTDTLHALDTLLGALEATIKELIDREATAQRASIIQARNSLGVSQRTSLLAGGALLLMSAALAAAVRRGLSSRLKLVVEADRLKSQLLANVSHELRTPINAIQGYSQLLVEDAYGALTGEQQTTIRRILLNTTQLQSMVNNLLDHAQIEQGKLTLRNAEFSPADFLETTHTALNILAVTKGLALTSEIAPDVPAMLIGDVLRLQQILFNLTSNGLKFTKNGSVHARIFLPDAAHWALEVTDTGIGIPLEAQAHIFAPFWQIDSSATREYRGSGLGLSIVKQLVDLMGGKIALASQPGKGSTFTIVFPMETI